MSKLEPIYKFIFTMFARNAQLAALLLFAALTSCSRQDELAGEVAGGEEIVTTVGVNVPELFRTRTVPDVYAGSGAEYLGTSGMPSLGNVDLKEHPLTFTVGVYIEKKKAAAGGDPEYALVGQPQVKQATDDNAYFEFRLLKNQKYRLVAYADFNAEGKEDLEAIPYTTTLNDELSDAFFASEDFQAAENVEVVLKRPFGKLRLVAHDFSTFAAGEAFKITKVTVAYQRAPMIATDTFNALTREFNYDKTAAGDRTVEAEPVSYTQEYTADGEVPVVDGKEGPVTVFTMYLPANFVSEGSVTDTPGQVIPDPDHAGTIPESYIYPFDVTVAYESVNDPTVKGTIERSYTIDIPVKRNWLTTVDATHFWSDNSGVMVTVHAAFEGEIKVEDEEQPTVKTAAELQAAITEICKKAPAAENLPEGEIPTVVGKIVLGNTIDMKDIKNGCIMFDTYPNDLKKRVEIYLDLNGHTITSDGTQNPGTSAKGILSIYSRNSILHIDDTSKEANGRIEYTGPADKAYRLVTCCYGGQVVINRGNFVSTSLSEVIYVYESESQRAQAQVEALKAIGIEPGENSDVNYPAKPTDPDQLATIEAKIKQLTSTATINGGWFENGYTGSVADKENVLINLYNVREANWPKYHDYAKRKGYPSWTDWGEYVNQTFGFMHVNGGSFVEFDPSRGDNIVGNEPIEWVGKGHVQTEIIDGKTVYTVIPEDEVHEF